MAQLKYWKMRSEMLLLPHLKLPAILQRATAARPRGACRWENGAWPGGFYQLGPQNPCCGTPQDTGPGPRTPEDTGPGPPDPQDTSPGPPGPLLQDTGPGSNSSSLGPA